MLQDLHQSSQVCMPVPLCCVKAAFPAVKKGFDVTLFQRVLRNMIPSCGFGTSLLWSAWSCSCSQCRGSQVQHRLLSSRGTTGTFAFSLTQKTGTYSSNLDVLHVAAKYTYLPFHVWSLLIFVLQICWRRIRNNQNVTCAAETLVSVHGNTRHSRAEQQHSLQQQSW